VASESVDAAGVAAADVAKVLKDAWKAVTVSGVPQHVQGAALSEAVRLLGSSDQAASAYRGAESDRESRAAPPSRPSNPKSEPEPALLTVTTNEGNFYAKFAHDSGVPEGKLREVYRVVGDQLHFALTKSALGDTETKKNQRVALLSVAPRWYVNGEPELAVSAIRAAARAAGYKPSRNLSAHIGSVAGTKPVGNGAGKAVRVQGAKIDAAFAALIDELVPEA